ncbi:hypothetical protein [Salibacterium aidingense]|uniref:hypothetical protein n=1 Tax=Salibacterium aidingense TaxID=384933 RepID=UPI003BBA91A8
MAFIPKYQSVTIVRPGGDDGWGGTLPGEETDMAARVNLSHEEVPDQHGDVVVSSAKIFLDDLAEVYYDDTIRYTDELGRTIEKKPVRIAPIIGIDGSAVETKVFL